MKFLFLSVLALFFSTFTTRAEEAPVQAGVEIPGLVLRDTTPDQIHSYQGYRLYLSGFEVSKRKDDLIFLRFRIINTGKEAVRLGSKEGMPAAMVVNWDESLSGTAFDSRKADITRELGKLDLHLLPGQMLMDREIRLSSAEPSSGGEKGDEGFTLNTSGDPSSTRFFDENYCPDLVIDTVRVVKRSKKYVTLEYRVTNYGKGPAPLFGEQTGKEDNVAVKAHLSSTSKLSRGAIVIGGAFIHDLPGHSQGVLAPNESFTASIKLDIRKKTRFTPVIILSLDAYQSVRECDETNNLNYVEVL